MAVSPEGSSINDAVRLLTSDDAARSALLRAYAAARRALEDDLTRPHPPGLEDRHAELIAFLGSPEESPLLSHATWLLVLSHLTADEQRKLQATFEELARSAETAIEYGEKKEGEVEEVMQTLAAVEELLAELPHTTFARSLGTDDHELRRRSLSVDIAWADRGSEEAERGGPVRVVWRDGYETTVATMGLAIGHESACWMLEVADPPPGRSASLVLEERPSDDPGDMARSLRQAIVWANRELGDHYIVHGSESQPA